MCDRSYEQWTRPVSLSNPEVDAQIAKEVTKVSPEILGKPFVELVVVPDSYGADKTTIKGIFEAIIIQAKKDGRY